MFIHSTADVSPEAKIGEGTKIWHFAQVRESAVIGENCIIGKNTYVDHDVEIGNNVKIQNNCSIYYGAIIEEGVFLAPHVILTNDKLPRAINPDGSLKTAKDWQVGRIVIKEGASIGTNSTLLTDIIIGRWVLIGAGSVVTKSIPDHGLAFGIPAKLKGFVCKCGFKLIPEAKESNLMRMRCPKCSVIIEIPKKDYALLENDGSA